MVTPSTGIAWQPVQHTLTYPSSTTGGYDTMEGVIAFQTDNDPRRTSAYLTFASGDPECLGMLVPPVKSEDDGRILTADASDGAVWRDPARAKTEWEHLNPYTQEFGVLKFVTKFIEEETDVWVNHHTSAYIGTVDVSGWVGEFLPHYETSDSGKILMVSPTNGPEWTNMPGTETTWNYGDSETRQGTLSVGTTLESNSPHHSSAYIEYNDSVTWLGAFVPPTDIGDIGKVLMVDATKGVEWKSPSNLSIYTSGTGITIDHNDNSINVSYPLPAVTPGADKILSTDANGNLTWMPKYTGNNYGITVNPTTNVISRGYEVIEEVMHATLTGAEIKSGSIKYEYRYPNPLYLSANPYGFMIVDWSVVCASGRKNNPPIGLLVEWEEDGGRSGLITIPGVRMQDSLSGWVETSRASGHFTHDMLDFDALLFSIYAEDGVFTSTDAVNLELRILYVGYYTRARQE